MKLRDKLLNEREELVVHLREEEKLTCREIGERLEVSGTMVNYIHHAARAKLDDLERNGEDALSLLPKRASRLVVILKIGSRARARAAMESGRLSWLVGMRGIIWEGAMLRRLSSRTWAALYEWAGRPTLPVKADSCKKLAVLDESGDDDQSRLRGRARLLVVNLEIGSRARARAAMESGRLSCNEGGYAIFWDGVMLPQVSRKTWAVLYEWAGRPVMPPFQGMRPLNSRAGICQTSFSHGLAKTSSPKR